MAQTKDLHEYEAIAKLREIVGRNGTCMFHTCAVEQDNTRPMMVQQVDDMGSLWFLSSRSSEQNEHIALDPRVMITIADSKHSTYLAMKGEASIVDDRVKKEELFSLFAKAWFPGGVNDPELTLLKVRPVNTQYWDTTDGKTVQLLKIAGAAITGKLNDSGAVQGHISV